MRSTNLISPDGTGGWCGLTFDVDAPARPEMRVEVAARAEEGTSIRVLDAERVRSLEYDAPLPEVVVDDHALYHVSYDKDWKACGARRIDDPEVIREATEKIAEL